jgi:phosphatidylserine/phosphatidylglycerophosphate/cardiolipin synthase-like enzyme
VALYGLENHAGTPVYVHDKVCVVDDVWASIGSDNLNLRSWTHDSELSCAVLDERRDDRAPQVVDRFDDGARVFARDLRLRLSREHLDREPGDDADLVDPKGAFVAFADSAAALQRWLEDGCRGPRPPGRLRPYAVPGLHAWSRLWATRLYETLYDPDGRPPALRRRGAF